MGEVEVAKARRSAVREALKELKDGMAVGLGSGRTMEIAVKEIAEFVKQNQLNVMFIPSSYQILFLASNSGLRVQGMEHLPSLDLVIDSFDQADDRGNLIKGGGAALTREKILCAAAKRVVFVADEFKLCGVLNAPVPLEVLPFALGFVARKVADVGGKLRPREGSGKVGPVISDNGNVICDADFGEIRDPAGLEEKLDRIPGIIENGLFIGAAKAIYVGLRRGGVKVLTY